MQEFFYEESSIIDNKKSAKTKYYILKVISVIFYIATVLWLIICFMALPLNNLLQIVIFGLIPIAIFLASGIIAGKFKDKFYVDYDYTIVTGSVRFSKVIKEIKRRNILIFDCSDIEKMGKINTDNYKKYNLMPNVKKIIATSNYVAGEGKEFYYIVCSVKGQKYLFTIECTKTFMLYVLKYSNRLVLDGEL